MAVFYYNHEAELYHSAMNPSPDELYHYGVKGMKWGKHVKAGIVNVYDRFRRGYAISQMYPDKTKYKANNRQKGSKNDTAHDMDALGKRRKDTLSRDEYVRKQFDMRAEGQRQYDLNEADRQKAVADSKRKAEISKRVDENIATQRKRNQEAMNNVLSEQEKLRKRKYGSIKPQYSKQHGWDVKQDKWVNAGYRAKNEPSGTFVPSSSDGRTRSVKEAVDIVLKKKKVAPIDGHSVKSFKEAADIVTKGQYSKRSMDKRVSKNIEGQRKRNYDAQQKALEEQEKRRRRKKNARNV